MMEFAIGLVIGAVIGAVLAVVIYQLRSRVADQRLRETFAALAGEALDANARRLGDSAAAALDGRKALIDQSQARMGEELEKVRTLLAQIESSRRQDFGTLGSSVASLSATAGELHKMLASTQRRGAWGERMAEDVLRLVGMQEGVNYIKQSSESVADGRPDFTFLLPNGLKANMDVKFPLERYKSYLDAADEATRAAELGQLTTAVRTHIAAVARRGYIDPKASTVNYVILFMPSEQLFSLVMESQRDLIDEALAKRIVLASPLTLYAMLAVIRQAAENANVTARADQIAAFLEEFNKQWQKYKEEMDKLGQKIDQTAAQFAALRGTRSNQLEKPLDRIEQLRISKDQ
ncbi:MAG: DNA recombination protein RmuC [Phycisphaerae bacterium]|jgi:DNA recombination protein RmuC